MHRLITTTWVCVLGLMMSSQYCHAGDLSFTSTSSIIKAGLTKTVHMHCELAATVSIDHVTSMVVTHGSGEFVASVTSNEAAKAFVTKGKLSVTGTVAGRGRLDLTWDKPSDMYTGNFTCEVTARSNSNRLVRYTSKVNLVASTPSISELAKKVGICSQNVAFHAVLMAHSNFGGGKTVVYPGVYTNVGNAYSKASGLFTCSVPGTYSFNVNAMSLGHDTAGTRYARLDMQLNSKRVASLFAGYKGIWESSSMSAVLDLKAGDVVRVMAINNSDLINHGGELNNVFNGQLIHATGC